MVGNMWLVGAYRATNGKAKCYPSIVENILGTGPSAIILVFMMLYILASSTSYYMFSYLFAKALVVDKFKWLQDTESTVALFKWIFVFSIFAIQFCGCLPKKLTALSYATLVSAIIIFYTSMVILADFFIQRNDYKTELNAQYKIIGINKHIFGSWGLALFSAVNQFAVCNIVGELERPSTKRLKTVVTKSYIFPIFIYLVVGVMGY